MDFSEYLDSNCSTSSAAGGAELIIHDDCPFEGCAGGKIYVNAKKGVGICFRCNTTFSGAKFVAAFEGVSYQRALAILGGDETRYEALKYERPGIDEPWYPQVEALPERALNYLHDRGFDNAFIEGMRLSFCSVPTEAPDGKTWYTQNRIIIYVYDRKGNVISWQGRDITGKSSIKYLFQPGFKGAESLYNIERINKFEPVIVVEGVMDAWGWMRAGYKNVVATWGKKISKKQIEALVELNPKQVYVAWDGDAYYDRAEFSRNFGYLFDIKIVEMGGKDADELSPEELTGKLSTASGYNWQDIVLGGLEKC